VYFKAKKKASKNTDAIGGLYQGIPAIPPPVIPWAVTKKRPKWAEN